MSSSSWRQSISSSELSISMLNDRSNINTAVKVTLVPKDTTQESRELTLGVGKPIIIGRASSKAIKNQIAAPDNALFENPVISRQHARLEWRTSLNNHNHFTITDLASTHGTYVNDVQLTHDQPHPLRDGDMIRLGASVSKGSGMFLSQDVVSSTDHIQDSYRALRVTFIIPRNSTTNENRRAFMVPISSDEEDDYGSEVEDEDLYGIMTSSPATSPQSSKKLGTIESPINIDDESNRLLPVIIDEEDMNDEEDVNDEEDMDNDDVVQETEQVVDPVVGDDQPTDDLETTFEQPQPESSQGPDTTDLTLEPVSQPIAMTEAPNTEAIPIETHQQKHAEEKDSDENLRWESEVPETYFRDGMFEDDEDDEDGPELWSAKLQPFQLPPMNVNNFQRQPRPVQPPAMYRPWSGTGNTSFTPDSHNRFNSLRSIPPPALMQQYPAFNGLRPLPLPPGSLPPFNEISHMSYEQRDPFAGLQHEETMFPSYNVRPLASKETAQPKKTESAQVEDHTANTTQQAVQEDAQVEAPVTNSAKKRSHEEMVEQSKVPSVSESPRPIKVLKTQKKDISLINEVGKYTLGAAIGATSTFAMLASPLGGMLADWASKL
ncbi:hypothetical protein MRB53_039846 [Persea americana]|nr:hypothetical protein MRB53_039846 [Persea americana]